MRVTRPYLILTYRHPVHVADASRYLHLSFIPSPTPHMHYDIRCLTALLTPSFRTKPYPM